MSSVDTLRDFVSERLTAAAEEIFGAFQRAVVEYEEEINRQRRLLDVFLKPEIRLQRIVPDIPQQHVCKEEEALFDQQLYNEERNFSLDQEDLELPQIKEEQEGVYFSQEGEKFELKKEPENFESAVTCEENDHSEAELMVVHQLLTHNSHVSENQENGSSIHSDSTPETLLHESTSHSLELSNSLCKPDTGKGSFKCDTCGDVFVCQSKLKIHLRVHKGQKIYTCKICGKIFGRLSSLKSHVSLHTDEKPYSCQTCGKRFLRCIYLNRHILIHTGKKPFACKSCGKTFRVRHCLTVHMRTHTGERPYSCSTCGKSFRQWTNLNRHARAHETREVFLCKICGKVLSNNYLLQRHMLTHTGEKLYTCSVCGINYNRKAALKKHNQTHTG